MVRARRFAVVGANGTEVDSFGLTQRGSRFDNDLTIGGPAGDSLLLRPSGLILSGGGKPGSGAVFLDQYGVNLVGPLGAFILEDGNEQLSPKARTRMKVRLLTGPILQMVKKGGSKVGLDLEGKSPTITLTDPAGFSMALGGAKLWSQTSGETRQTSAASIVMFGNDKDHKVIWQAPN